VGGRDVEERFDLEGEAESGVVETWSSPPSDP
jgi:hypothetical protein